MTFGPEKITTGAGNDIERATAMARRMVTQFGMSDIIGPMSIGDSEQEVFLGRELTHRRTISESVAERVDGEVKRLLDEAYTTAVETIEQNRPLLETIAESLLERETLDREEIQLLAAGEPLPEARVIRQAREFAEALRRDGGDAIAPPGEAVRNGPRNADHGTDADAGEEEVAMTPEPEPDPSR
jgi:cell division protease FtsH